MNTVIYGGSQRFVAFLRSISGNTVTQCTDLESTLRSVLQNSPEVLFLLPHYDNAEMAIPEFREEEASLIAQIIHEGRTKIYIENYPSYDFRDCFVFGLQARGQIGTFGKNSICLSNSCRESLGFDILQKRNGFCFTCNIHTNYPCEILAEVKNCLGVHKIAVSEETRSSIALLRVKDNVFCSMADLTNLQPPEIFSYQNWKKFYRYLLCTVLGASGDAVERAFTDTYERIDIARGKRSPDRKTALEHSIAEAIRWHRNSGVMLNDGRNGVYEMIRSFDLNVAKNLRGDSSLFTAALFMAAGVQFGNSDYCETAETIADYMLNQRGLQITEGNNAGLFKWFSGTFNLGAQQVYVSDTARVANSIFTLWKLTGKEEYLQRLLLCGEAILRWFGGEALLPGCSLNFSEEDTQTVQSRKRGASPEYYDAPILFLKNLYLSTGDERYLEQIRKTAGELARIYPNFSTVTSHSDNFTYSRVLCIFAVAESLESGPWTPLIDKLLQFFANLQHPSGGFADAKPYYDSTSIHNDVEFAVGFDNDNCIADFVYCQNTMLYTLDILLNSPNQTGFDVGLCQEMFQRLIDFLLDTQICSQDNRLHGAWMRAFDMDAMEYYGCDKDFLWGPYCILTGWTTGAIPLVFLHLLGTKTMY